MWFMSCCSRQRACLNSRYHQRERREGEETRTEE